jgi:hypothetical protein
LATLPALPLPLATLLAALTGLSTLLRRKRCKAQTKAHKKKKCDWFPTG